MLSETYEFARGASNTSTGGPSTAYLFAPTNWRVTLTKLSAASTLTPEQIAQGQISTITAELLSGGVSVTQTVEVTGDRADRIFNLSLNVAKGDNVRLWVSTSNSRFYYANDMKYCAGGWTGDNWIPQTRSWYDCVLNISYDPIWTIDGQNDGYPYPIGTDPTPFTEFEKDADGYPLNWGVWKLDGQNDGYPWPTGFLPIHAVGGGIYKKINGVLYPVLIYKKVNGVLYPVLIYKKVNGNLVPI